MNMVRISQVTSLMPFKNILVLSLLTPWICWSALTLFPGECVSNPDHKVYLGALKRNNASNIRQEIGADRIDSLENSDQNQYYFCRVTCLGPQSQEHRLWVLLSEPASRHNDMQGFQCPHVSIQNVQIVGSIWGPQPVVAKFEAFSTHLFEIHSWLKSTGFQLSDEELNRRLTLLRPTLHQVGLAYLQARSAVLNEAGVRLLEIAALTEKGRADLLNIVRELNSRNWEIQMDYTRADSFIANLIKVNGRFLQYSNLLSDRNVVIH